VLPLTRSALRQDVRTQAVLPSAESNAGGSILSARTGSFSSQP
jgi:hypothetical protein